MGNFLPIACGTILLPLFVGVYNAPLQSFRNFIKPLPITIHLM